MTTSPNEARGRIRSWFARPSGAPADTDIHTEEDRMELQNDSTGATTEADAPPARWSFDHPGSHDVPPIRLMKLALTRGDVTVLGRDEAGARVEVHEISGVPLDADLDGGVLRLAPQRSGSSGTGASLTVEAHRGTAIEVAVVSAEVLVSGMKQGLRIRTVSGDVVCDATAGPARLESTSGELGLREHEGPVEVTTVSGATTASGPITRFSSESVSADLFLDLESPDRVEARTVSGEVVLRLRPERAADYVISTVSGEVEVDGCSIGRTRGEWRGGWSGPAGAEPARVRVSTASGTVRIVHSGDA